MNIHHTTITGRRNTNEDRHNIILNINKTSDKLNSINMLGIYDGHGGTHTSKYLEKNLPLYYCNKNVHIPVDEAYHTDVFQHIQNNLLEHNNGYCTGSTCLMNIMYRHKNMIHMNIVNLGDSRLTIVYKNGSHKQITTDHKPDEINEKMRITKMGGDIYRDSEGTVRIGDLSLSRAFGDGDNAPYISQKPDVYYKKITSETKYVVMACDGLWDVINNDELFGLLNSYNQNNSTNLAADLALDALHKGSTDNISIIIIEIK